MKWYCQQSNSLTNEMISQSNTDKMWFLSSHKSVFKFYFDKSWLKALPLTLLQHYFVGKPTALWFSGYIHYSSMLTTRLNRWYSNLFCLKFFYWKINTLIKSSSLWAYTHIYFLFMLMHRLKWLFSLVSFA